MLASSASSSAGLSQGLSGNQAKPPAEFLQLNPAPREFRHFIQPPIPFPREFPEPPEGSFCYVLAQFTNSSHLVPSSDPRRQVPAFDAPVGSFLIINLSYGTKSNFSTIQRTIITQIINRF